MAPKVRKYNGWNLDSFLRTAGSFKLTILDACGDHRSRYHQDHIHRFYEYILGRRGKWAAISYRSFAAAILVIQ